MDDDVFHGSEWTFAGNDEGVASDCRDDLWVQRSVEEQLYIPKENTAVVNTAIITDNRYMR